MALPARRLPSLPRVPASPVPRSRRYYEGATTSHPRIYGHSLVRARSPRDPSSFVFAVALPEGRRSLPGLALCWCRRPISGLLSRGREWDLSGLQAILPVPLLRSGTPVEPTCPRHVGHVDVAPAGWTAKASANCISGLTRSFGTCCHTLHAVIAAHVQGLLPAGWLPFTGWVSNPLDRYERFQLVLTVIHPSCSPDATTLHRLRHLRAIRGQTAVRCEGRKRPLRVLRPGRDRHGTPDQHEIVVGRALGGRHDELVVQAEE